MFKYIKAYILLQYAIFIDKYSKENDYPKEDKIWLIKKFKKIMIKIDKMLGV